MGNQIPEKSVAATDEIFHDFRRPMIQSLHIENFRCYKTLDLKDFGKVNVIVGDNGSGKTSLLEAIFLPTQGAQVPVFYRSFRGMFTPNFSSEKIQYESIYTDLFYGLSNDSKVKISLRGSSENSRDAILSFEPNPKIPLLPNDQPQNTKLADGLFGIPPEPIVAAREDELLPPVYILMIPWKDQPGCLETLCLSSLNEKYNNPQLKCVEEMVKCVGADKWRPGMLAKFRVQCLLSSIFDESPAIHLRFAWDVNPNGGRPADKFPVFPLTHKVFEPIVDFLRQFIQ